MVEQVNTHGFRRDLIFPDGFERSSVRRIQQQSDHYIGHRRRQKNVADVVQRRDIFDSQRAVGNGLGVGDHNTNNLGKTQCRNGQIIAPQTQYRRADQTGDDRGKDTAQQQGRPQRQINIYQRRMHWRRIKYIRPQIHRYSKNTHHIRADGHEPGLPQRKLTGKTIGNVHGQTDDRVNKAEVGNTANIGVHLSLYKTCCTE